VCLFAGLVSGWGGRDGWGGCGAPPRIEIKVSHAQRHGAYTDRRDHNRPGRARRRAAAAAASSCTGEETVGGFH